MAKYSRRVSMRAVQPSGMSRRQMLISHELNLTGVSCVSSDELILGLWSRLRHAVHIIESVFGTWIWRVWNVIEMSRVSQSAGEYPEEVYSSRYFKLEYKIIINLSEDWKIYCDSLLPPENPRSVISGVESYLLAACSGKSPSVPRQVTLAKFI